MSPILSRGGLPSRGWVSALVSAGAAIFARHQWRKIDRKLAMLTDAGRAAKVLPA
jgi:hypothetical protein